MWNTETYTSTWLLFQERGTTDTFPTGWIGTKCWNSWNTGGTAWKMQKTGIGHYPSTSFLLEAIPYSQEELHCNSLRQGGKAYGQVVPGTLTGYRDNPRGREQQDFTWVSGYQGVSICIAERCKFHLFYSYQHRVDIGRTMDTEYEYCSYPAGARKWPNSPKELDSVTGTEFS